MIKVNMNVQNKFTRNLIKTLDNKGITQKEGIDKIRDYVKYLSSKTNISKYRLRKMLTYDVAKLITADDMDTLANVLNITCTVFYMEEDSTIKSD